MCFYEHFRIIRTSAPYTYLEGKCCWNLWNLISGEHVYGKSITSWGIVLTVDDGRSLRDVGECSLSQIGGDAFVCGEKWPPLIPFPPGTAAFWSLGQFGPEKEGLCTMEACLPNTPQCPYITRQKQHPVATCMCEWAILGPLAGRPFLLPACHHFKPNECKTTLLGTSEIVGTFIQRQISLHAKVHCF